LCIFVLPLIIKDAGEGSAEMAYVLYGILTIMYVSGIPFYFALYQAFTILKNGRAKAIRFSTLEAICKALDCQPGDILEYRSDDL
jgi:Cro/C1-type HTH DNA-binding domain